MYSAKRQIGNRGEDIACRFLVRKGFTILHRNFLARGGEVDIVAEIANTLHFVEVKAVRRSLTNISREIDFRPEEMVHPAKLRKIALAAELYVQQRGDSRDYQIDVVGVIMDEVQRKARCRLFEQVL